MWFLSLDAAKLPAVVAARQGFRLPYYWSKMTFGQDGDEVRYRCDRRWPDGDRLGRRAAVANPRSTVRMRIGDAIPPADVSDFENFLSARWRLYSSYPRGLRYALAWHEPWPLHRAEPLHVDDQLVQASGLPKPEGEPICHWSPGVEVRIGTLRNSSPRGSNHGRGREATQCFLHHGGEGDGGVVAAVRSHHLNPNR